MIWTRFFEISVRFSYIVSWTGILLWRGSSQHYGTLQLRYLLLVINLGILRTLSPYGDDVICEWYHIEDSLVGHSLAQLSRHLNIASKLCATGIRAQKLIREKEILSNAHRYMHSTYIILCIQYIIDSKKTQNVFHTNVFAIHLPHVSKILSPHNIQKLASLLLTSCLLSKRVVKIFSLVLILL